MHPDGAAMQKVSGIAAERHHQLLRTLQFVAGKIDHHIRIQTGNALAKASGFLFDSPVHLHPLDHFPSCVPTVRLLQAPADTDDCVTGLDQAWGQKAPDMTGSTDDRYPHLVPPRRDETPAFSAVATVYRDKLERFHDYCAPSALSEAGLFLGKSPV